MKKELVKYSFLMAVGELAYIFLVVLFMRNAQKILGNDQNIISTMAFLLVVVLSASVSGALILGKPIMLYLDNKKKEAIILFSLTLGWFLLFIIIALIVSMLF
jgi:uncharacterized membrane protein YbhN (UPF0104 family)